MRLLFILLFVFGITVTNFAQEPVKWYTIEEAFELTQKEPRKIMIDVYTDWCTWCKVMDANTFNNEVIASYLNEKYYPVKLNAEQKEEITLNGHVFKFIPEGSRGYHELAAALLNGQMSYPSVVFLDEKAQMIQPIAGYIRARQFDGIIKFIGDDRYKSENWTDFQASYESPIAEETTAGN